MKKLMLFAVLFVILVTIGIAVFVIVKFSSVENEATSVTVSENKDISAIEQHAKANYPQYHAIYDENSKTLTLQKSTDFSIASAQSIYTDPSTYLNQAQLIALNISTVCDEPELTVVLCYLSKDGEPMLSVASNGKITKYWE